MDYQEVVKLENGVLCCIRTIKRTQFYNNFQHVCTVNKNGGGNFGCLFFYRIRIKMLPPIRLHSYLFKGL